MMRAADNLLSDPQARRELREWAWHEALCFDKPPEAIVAIRFSQPGGGVIYFCKRDQKGNERIEPGIGFEYVRSFASPRSGQQIKRAFNGGRFHHNRDPHKVVQYPPDDHWFWGIPIMLLDGTVIDN